MTYLEIAKNVIKIESKAILALSEQLTHDFQYAVESILACKGRVVVCGMGKSGIIGNKISATLSSTGTPSFFMHPGEAYHGDLGMVTSNDVFLALSNSGETEEIIRLLPILQANKNIVISITGNKKSTLSEHSDYHLKAWVEEEACALKLAPTSSTTAALVIGDALSVALMHARNFKEEDFAKFHPGGSLGKKLLTRVEDLMYRDDIPLLSKEDTIKEVINEITKGRFGTGIIIEAGVAVGIISDGDLRRAMEKYEADIFKYTAKDIMTCNPIKINSDKKITDALEVMNEQNITILVVEKNGHFQGLLRIYDCDI